MADGFDDDLFAPFAAPRDGERSFLARLNAGVAKERAARGLARRSGTPSSATSGRFNARGRGRAAMAGGLAPSYGWTRDGGMAFRNRRVIVKARVMKLGAAGIGRARAHLAYLQRDGATLDREGEKDRGSLYGPLLDEADGEAFLKRSAGDRHQFRLIVSPEDGERLASLRPFVRDLMADVESDLGTKLDWVAVDHHDTGHPHAHIVVRGATEDGKVLNIAGDCPSSGFLRQASG